MEGTPVDAKFYVDFIKPSTLVQLCLHALHLHPTPTRLFSSLAELKMDTFISLSRALLETIHFCPYFRVPLSQPCPLPPIKLPQQSINN